MVRGSVLDYTSWFWIGIDTDHMQLRLYSYQTLLIHIIISLTLSYLLSSYHISVVFGVEFATMMLLLWNFIAIVVFVFVFFFVLVLVL